MNKNLKIRFFKSTVESVLLYGSECWTITNSTEKRHNGNYTRLLTKVQNVSWDERLTNEELYGLLPPTTHVIKTRRLRFIGHVWRRKEETLHQLLPWEPGHRKRSRGCRKTRNVDQACIDTNMTKEQLGSAINDRELWRTIVKGVRVHLTR